MKKLVICGLAILSSFSIACAQEPALTMESAPLIAWSVLQTPLPVAGSDNAVAQSFTGTVVRDDSGYLLLDEGGRTCQMDDQAKARPNLGSKVTVLGTVDQSRPLIHVQAITMIP
jgi:hypothetical protein